MEYYELKKQVLQKRSVMKVLFTIFFAVMFSGCIQSGHMMFYKQVAPSKYSPTSKVMIFEYRNVDLEEIYQLFYSDFLIIGKSKFNGPYEDPELARSYAESIGADVFITSFQFKEALTSFLNLSTPTSSTTNFSGYSGGDSFYGTATSYSTQTTTVPVQVNRYDQVGIYLKNVNNVNPLWKQIRSQYKSTGTNEFTGIWKNENYEIKIIQSGDQTVGFLNVEPKEDENFFAENEPWFKDQLKMTFNKQNGVGVYLGFDKKPIPSKFKINKFGYLEVKSLINSDIFSFAKISNK